MCALRVRSPFFLKWFRVPCARRRFCLCRLHRRQLSHSSSLSRFACGLICLCRLRLTIRVFHIPLLGWCLQVESHRLCLSLPFADRRLQVVSHHLYVSHSFLFDRQGFHLKGCCTLSRICVSSPSSVLRPIFGVTPVWCLCPSPAPCAQFCLTVELAPVQFCDGQKAGH